MLSIVIRKIAVEYVEVIKRGLSLVICIVSKNTKWTVKWQRVCDVLSDLAPFVQFKKREKHSWESAIFTEVAGF